MAFPFRKMNCSDPAASGRRERVAVAMSGGVDSSVTAALLLERGYDVLGVTMRLWKEPGGKRGGADAVEDARRVCAVLGIEFREVDYRRTFKAAVVDYFVETYSRAETPNPCIACNRRIKFGLLLDQVRQDFGAAFLATGHYVRKAPGEDGRWRLLRGIDARKDQSYVLYMLGQDELARLLFPLGDCTKDRVRELARLHRLPVAERAESQEICFVADDDYRRFLRDNAPAAAVPGPILDRSGTVLGRHDGLAFYTIGQRSGLRIAAPHPLYVLQLDSARNALIVGAAPELGRSDLRAEAVSYVSGRRPDDGLRITAKIRYNARPAAAMLHPLEDGSVAVQFDAPLRDISPGQAVVFYQGDDVLGGGTISAFP